MRNRMMLVILVAVALLCILMIDSVQSAPESSHLSPARNVVESVEFLGVVTYTTGYTCANTEVGGLSAITYDASRDIYYVLSDDRSEKNPARFYQVTMSLIWTARSCKRSRRYPMAISAATTST